MTSWFCNDYKLLIYCIRATVSSFHNWAKSWLGEKYWSVIVRIIANLFHWFQVNGHKNFLLPATSSSLDRTQYFDCFQFLGWQAHPKGIFKKTYLPFLITLSFGFIHPLKRMKSENKFYALEQGQNSFFEYASLKLPQLAASISSWVEAARGA